LNLQDKQLVVGEDSVIVTENDFSEDNSQKLHQNRQPLVHKPPPAIKQIPSTDYYKCLKQAKMKSKDLPPAISIIQESFNDETSKIEQTGHFQMFSNRNSNRLGLAIS